MADQPRAPGQIAKLVYAIVGIISVIIAIVKFAEFGLSLMSAAQPAPLLTDHFETAGRGSAENMPAAPYGHAD